METDVYIDIYMHVALCLERITADFEPEKIEKKERKKEQKERKNYEVVI